MTSSFSLALHALVYLHRHGGPVSSKVLSEKICTNPARVRQVAGRLREAGLLEPHEGHAGGYAFTGCASTLPLGQNARAVAARFVFSSWRAGGPAAEWIPFPAEAVSGNSFTLPNAIPTRRGYQFLGWNSNPDGSGDWYQPEDVIERIMADLTLYAQWTAAPPPPCRPSCGWFWYGCGFPGLTC